MSSSLDSQNLIAHYQLIYLLASLNIKAVLQEPTIQPETGKTKQHDRRVGVGGSLRCDDRTDKGTGWV